MCDIHEIDFDAVANSAAVQRAAKGEQTQCAAKAQGRQDIKTDAEEVRMHSENQNKQVVCTDCIQCSHWH
jgi:hypothetical protein